MGRGIGKRRARDSQDSRNHKSDLKAELRLWETRRERFYLDTRGASSIWVKRMALLDL